MDIELQQDRVFRALADARRREIVAMLSAGSRAVAQIQAEFDVSQPAVSQHLKILREAGLVSERRQGRSRIYELDGDTLRLAQDWLEQHIEFWSSRLEKLGAHLRSTHGPNT